MRIGIIGAGGMGKCLAFKLIGLGHYVTMANSRGKTSLQPLTEEIGVDAIDIEDVVTNMEIIIVSIPQKNISDLPKELFQNVPTNVVIIDTGNYYPNLRDGHISSLEQSGIDSLWVQQQLGIPVIKVFNSILAESLLDKGKPNGAGKRIAISVAGDNPASKEIVFTMVDAMGFDPFDGGSISQSWKQQPGSPIYCRDLHIDELQKRYATMDKSWADMRDTILNKRSSDEGLMKSDYAAYLVQLQN